MRMAGPLWATSTFPFEGGNGEVSKLVSAAKGMPRQITECIVMHGVMQSFQRLVTLPAYLEKQHAIISGKSTKQSQTCVLGAPLPPCVFDENVLALIREAVGSGAAVSEYLRARVRSIILHSAKCTRAEKTCSSYIEDYSGDVYQIQGVFAAGTTILLLCQEIICQQYFLPFMYNIEHPSSHVGQCLLRESSMASLCVLVNRGETFVLAKMPNVFEGD